MRTNLTLVLIALLVAGAGWWLHQRRDSRLIVNPATLDFGQVPVGGSAQHMLIATNVSDEPLEVERIRLAEGVRVSRAGFELPPGESLELAVTYAPQTTGHVDGTLRFEGRSVRADVAVTGSSTLPPSIAVAPLYVAFGEVAVGSRLTTRLSVENSGGSPLEISSLGVGGVFRAEPASLEVAPGSRELVSLHFEPSTEGPVRKRLIVRSNDPQLGTISIELDGTGVGQAPQPSIRVSPGTIDFGEVAVGETVHALLEIHNDGTDPLQLASFRYEGAFHGSEGSRRIEPGGKLRVPIDFTPRDAGGQRGELVIVSNDPVTDELRVDLLGEGLAAGRTAERPRPERVLAGSGLSRTAPTPGGFDLSSLVSGSGAASERSASDPSLLPEGDAGADPGADRDAPPPGPPTIEVTGGQVRLGSYSTPIQGLDVANAVFDPATGRFSLEGFDLPPVHAALGETFQFSTASGFGFVDNLGDVDIALPVEILDDFGNPTPVSMTLTTGLSTAVLQGGVLVSEVGKPLGSDGRARLVGVMTLPTGTSFGGDQMRITLDVQVVHAR